jgi:transcription elongation factor S-II
MTETVPKKNFTIVLKKKIADPAVTFTSNYDAHPKRVFVRNKLLTINLMTDQLANECEIAIYDTIISKLTNNDDFEKLYSNLSLSIIRNLDPDSSVGNKFLLQNLLSGTITPSQLATNNPKDLFPDKWNAYKEQRLREINIISKQQEVTTDLFTCSKCKESKCTYYQLQIRSQDEPMTTFITCTFCGKTWTE